MKGIDIAAFFTVLICPAITGSLAAGLALLCGAGDRTVLGAAFVGIGAGLYWVVAALARMDSAGNGAEAGAGEEERP